MSSTSDIKLPDDFSLVQGGPLFQLFLRGRLSTSGLGLLKRRIIFFSLFTWLPLLLLSLASGQALSGVNIPFLYDVEAHVRFLLALPLLLLAEFVVHIRLRPVIAQFLERDIVTAASRSGFDACIASALRLRNSLWAEITLIVFVFSVGHAIWFEQLSLGAATWYAAEVAEEIHLTPAGYWFAYVSLPIYQFLLFRWLWRIFVWSRFLWQVARLDLHLVPTHPDAAGGLGFLAGSVKAFVPFLLSQGALLSAMIAGRIFYDGAALLDFKKEIIAASVLFSLLALGPLCVFGKQLAEVKRQGLLQYGMLASRYVREFEAKWLQGGAAPDEEFVGSGDIQSLADLNNSFEIVQRMRIFPIDKNAVLQAVAAVLLPLLPLMLTMISLEDLLKRLVGMLL